MRSALLPFLVRRTVTGPSVCPTIFLGLNKQYVGQYASCLYLFALNAHELFFYIVELAGDCPIQYRAVHELVRPTPRRCDDGLVRGRRPGPHPTVDPAQFREAMSQLGAAVHVVTTAGPAGKRGSRRPRWSRCPTSRRPCWSASTAAARRRRSSRRTACCASTRCAPARSRSPTCSRGARRVHDGGALRARRMVELSTGSPVLSDAVVACDCRVIEIKAVATHNVIFAGVVGRAARPGRAGARLSRARLQAGLSVIACTNENRRASFFV